MNPTCLARPTRLLALFVVAAAALCGLLIPVEAEAAKPRGNVCAAVKGKVSKRATATVTIVRRNGISCKRARRVVRRCFKRSAIKHWHLRRGLRLRAGKRGIRVRVRGKAKPACLTARKAPRQKRSNLGLPSSRVAGPYQDPLRLPPRSYATWDWVSPVTSWQASEIDVGTTVLNGKVLNKTGEVRSVWFEYGRTRDLGSSTERQPAKMEPTGEPVAFSEKIRRLKAKTRYYWRAMASIGPDGNAKTYAGAIGSFVTEPYRSLAGDNPCSQPQFGGKDGGVTQVTPSLAIVCSPMQYLVNDKKIVISVGYHGSLSCPVDYPHNLNAGSTTVRLPKIGYEVTFNKMVNYWRSNDSARFTTFPGYQKHYAGAEVGPLVGWHDWDIDQWGYLFKTSRTDVQLWIHCTDVWNAFSPEQLAPEQGTDVPTATKPPTPTGLTMTKVEGGWKAKWNAVAGVPDGIAGYQLAIIPTAKYSPETVVRLSDSGTEAFRSDAHIKAITDISKTNSLFAILWAISSEGNRSATPMVVPFTVS